MPSPVHIAEVISVFRNCLSAFVKTYLLLCEIADKKRFYPRPVLQLVEEYGLLVERREAALNANVFS